METQIEAFQKQLEQISELCAKGATVSSAEFVRWREATRRRIREVFGADSEHLETFDHIRFVPGVHVQARHMQDGLNREAFLGGAESAKARLLVIIDEPTERTQMDEQPHPAQPQSPTALQLLEGLIERFDIAARQLTRRHDDRETLVINDEYDVQDFLHALLKALFDDVRPEEYIPSRAGASSRSDFLLKNERIVVEAKMTNDRLRDKQVGEQLIIDIERYQSHQDCNTLVCIVYDPSHHISNPAALEKDLSRKHNGLEVRVFVVPR